MFFKADVFCHSEVSWVIVLLVVVPTAAEPAFDLETLGLLSSYQLYRNEYCISPASKLNAAATSTLWRS